VSLAEYLARNRERQLEELFQFLRIPSVSGDRQLKAEVRQAALFLVEQLSSSGLRTQLFDTPGHPIVYAERLAGRNLPTVLIYGHYDVQPADPLELWESPPFEPTLRGDAIVARGAMDNKGQIYAHVKGAEALSQVAGELPVNLKFLIEGEEEIGSPNLERFIEANRGLLAADAVIISDGAMIAPETPTITYGQKGLASLEVRVRGAGADLHSGTFGGAVPNPLNGLASMIARLHDDSGKVAVPGFYDDVVEIDESERESFSRVPFDEAEFIREAELTATPGEEGFSVLERLWARPTLDVNGLGGGFQGEGPKTVIPRAAMAKITCRLVPDQDPMEITRKLADFLRQEAPAGLSVDIVPYQGSYPAKTDPSSPACRAAAMALRDVYGREPVLARSGGSLPVVSDFQRLLDCDVVLVGLGLETDRIHSPNEKFDLVNYYRGIETSAALLERLAAELLPRRSARR
jgi:acetylornithine deacetylase/succinyl-diaminopimelate desuccinylase-like protein